MMALENHQRSRQIFHLLAVANFQPEGHSTDTLWLLELQPQCPHSYQGADRKQELERCMLAVCQLCK